MNLSIRTPFGKAILRIVIALVIIAVTGLLVADGMERLVKSSGVKPPDEIEWDKWNAGTFATYVNLTLVSMALFLLWYLLMGLFGAFLKRTKDVLGLWGINLGYMLFSLAMMAGCVVYMWNWKVTKIIMGEGLLAFYPKTNILAVLLMWLILFACTHLFAPDTCYRFKWSFGIGKFLRLRMREPK